MKIQHWLCAAISLGLMGFCLGCSGAGGNAESPDERATTDDQTAVTDDGTEDGEDEKGNDGHPESSPPPNDKVTKMTSKEFRLAMMNQDKRAFDEKHNGKRFELTGTVFNVLILRSQSTGEHTPTVVFCVLKDESKPFDGHLNVDPKMSLYCFTNGELPWKQLGPGAKATLRGKYYGRRTLYYLEDCTIVSTDGEPLPTLTVDQLVKAFKDDPERSKEKYIGMDKQLIVTGVIDRFGDVQGKQRPFMQTLDGTDVWITYGGDNQLMDVKAGDKVELLTYCAYMNTDGIVTIWLADCYRCDKLN